MILNRRMNQRIFGVLALVALAAACSGNGPPATGPDPNNPMGGGYQYAPTTTCPTSATTCSVKASSVDRSASLP